MAAGTVRWFNDSSGYGFIAPDEGGRDLYVRTGSIAGVDRESLSSGDRVEFESRVAGMGPEAIEVVFLASAATPVGERGGP